MFFFLELCTGPVPAPFSNSFRRHWKHVKRVVSTGDELAMQKSNNFFTSKISSWKTRSSVRRQYCDHWQQHRRSWVSRTCASSPAPERTSPGHLQRSTIIVCLCGLNSWFLNYSNCGLQVQWLKRPDLWAERLQVQISPTTVQPSKTTRASRSRISWLSDHWVEFSAV